LQWPQGTFASKLEVQNNHLTVTREIDGGLETLTLQLPAIITTDLRLNTPRFISLPNIVQAKKKPLTIVELTTLSVDIKARIRTLKYQLPEKKRQCQEVNSVQELVERLKNEAQVI
jgi:electron transfer flavoprotein beta subunit